MVRLLTSTVTRDPAGPRRTRQARSSAARRGLHGVVRFVCLTTPHIRIHTQQIQRRKHSLVVAANVMGELPSDKARLAALQIMWSMVDPEGGELLLIEPATKWGFRTIASAREVLADPENHDVEIQGPCTHNKTCPMTVSKMNPRKMWCQFPQRTPFPAVDSTLQKKKSVRSFPPTTKFSYVRARAVGGKKTNDDESDVNTLHERIIATPLLRNQHLIMDTCDSNGELNRRTISKGKMKPFPGKYRTARKSETGDVWVHPESIDERK